MEKPGILELLETGNEDSANYPGGGQDTIPISQCALCTWFSYSWVGGVLGLVGSRGPSGFVV